MLGRMLLRSPARSRLSRSLSLSLPLATPLPLPLLQTAPESALRPRAPLTLAVRTYATPGRPKSVVGEPSRPVKRSVKKAATKPADGTSAAEKKVSQNKKKAASKPKKKKALTPEQQEAVTQRKAALASRKKELRQKTKDKTALVDLKAAALDPPKSRAYPNAWAVYFAEQVKKHKGGPAIDIAKVATETAANYKNLAPADLEHYNHLHHTANEAAQAAYTRWVESKSAEQIRLANNARTALRKKYPKSSKWKDIQDPRRVKRPASAFNLFASNRHASGDFNNIKVTDRATLISQEWKALNDAEANKYRKLAEQDRKRYADEHQRVYGQPPRYMTAEDAAAAN